MIEGKLSLSKLQNKKTDCCQARLLPLIQRIEDLETQLRLEIERRETDYNDLLRLVVKEKVQTAGVKSSQPFISIKERKSRAEKSPEKLNKKQNVKYLLGRKASTKRIVSQKNKEQRDANPNDSVIAIQERTKLVEQGLEYQQNEFDKMKELNEYLMEQMLLIFEKIKDLEIKQQTTLKEIQSVETISSMVLEGEARQEHIKTVNNLGNNKKPDIAQYELSALISKVAQHQNVLSELIKLTRQVSSQISLSPKKPQQMFNFND